MKAITRSIAVVAAALMIAVVPVLAQEGAMGQQEPQAQKDECLLVAKNCPVDSIQERIQRIQSEIDRGTSVYTKEEMRDLNRELEDAQMMLNSDEVGGA